MKIKILSITYTFIILFIFYNCDGQTISQKNNDKLLNALLVTSVVQSGDSSCSKDGNFWARNLTGDSTTLYCVQSTLAASGTHVKVYVENNLVTGLDYKNIADTYDNQIYPVESKAFGTPPGTNNKKYVTILILDIKDGSTQNSGFVAGFVDPINFYPDGTEGYHSNYRDMLYIDGKDLVALRTKDMNAGKPDTLLSTIAHENQHLLRFQYSNGSDDTWIDEGTSEIASDLTGFGPQTARFKCFRGDSSSTCTNGIRDYSLFDWQSKVASYAYAYSFMSYLYLSSGDTETDRFSFLKQSVSGTTVRASDASSLMDVFKTAAKYNSSLLGTNNTEIFKKLLVSFAGQAMGYTSLTNTYMGNKTQVANMDSIRTTYPFDSTLSALYTPSPMPAIELSSLPTSLYPTKIYRVNSSSSGLTSGTDWVLVTNSANTEFVVFNGSIKTLYSSSGAVAKSDINNLQYPRFTPTEQEGIICPNEHLNKIHQIEKFKFNLQ